MVKGSVSGGAFPGCPFRPAAAVGSHATGAAIGDSVGGKPDGGASLPGRQSENRTAAEARL